MSKTVSVFYLPCGHTHGLAEELHDLELRWGCCINCHRGRPEGRMTASMRTAIETPELRMPK